MTVAEPTLKPTTSYHFTANVQEVLTTVHLKAKMLKGKDNFKFPHSTYQLEP